MKRALIGRVIAWLLAGITFFLSLWIVLPGPNLTLLPLAVGAPEISPLLLLGGVLALVIASWQFRRPPRLLIVILIVTLALSSLPLMQLPGAIAQAEASMRAAFPASGSKEAATYPPFSGLIFFRGFPASTVRVQTGIQFASPAGNPLFLDLYQPPSPGRYPAVITIYGGSWAAGSPAESATLSRFLAERGYVVAAIDYRHAPEYLFPTQLEDVQTALAFVRDHADEYEIAGDRLGLLGWSAGAHLAMLTGFRSNAAVRSIVDYYGPVDLAAGYSDPPVPDPIDVKQVLAAFIGGTPDELPEAYAQASPIVDAKAAEANSLPPTLLIYGGRDHIVEVRFGRRLYDALTEGGNTAVWVKIPWAEHAFDKVFNGVSNQLALHFIERFLDQTLLR
ncbi:MAG: alpha/beta hydrolase [Phormidesmis sp.]